MPLFLGLNGTFLSDINKHNCGPSALRQDVRRYHVDTEPPSLPGGESYPHAHGTAARVRPAAGSLQSPKEQCVRHRLPASATPTVFPRRIILRSSCEALPAAGGGDREASGEGQRAAACRRIL